MPKLPKGMYRRGRAFYCRLYEDGREVRRSLGSDYEAACRKLRVLRSAGQSLVPSRVTVAEAARRWLETAVRNGRNDKGLRNAETRVRKYLEPFLGGREVVGIARNDLRDFRTWLERRGCSVSLVHHVLTDARCFFRWCEDSSLIQQAPIPRRWLPRLVERPPDRLSDAEVQAVSTVPEPYGFVVRLAMATGLRWGELARALAEDVWNGVLVVRATKNGKLRRVPLPSSILRELEGRVGPLVPFRDAEAIAVRVRKHSGVARFHMHQTRHTFACRYLERGGSLHALQLLLGHSSVVVTQRYARLGDQAVLAEVRRLEGSGVPEGRTGTETGTEATLPEGADQSNLR